MNGHMVLLLLSKYTSTDAQTQSRDKAMLETQGCLSVMYDLHPPPPLPTPRAISSSASAVRQTEEMKAGEFISHAGIVSAW